MDDLKLPSYPVVTFLVARGGIVAMLAGLLPLAAAAWIVAAGGSPAFIAGGLVAGGAVWLFVRSYVEVLRILADALMPR